MTKWSPFEAVHGRQPRMGMEPTHNHPDRRLQNANDMVERMKWVKEETEAALRAVAEDKKQYYDACHQPKEFKPGDEVWLNAKDLTTEQLSKKLNYKQLGPFRILRNVNDLAYKLKLPRSFKIHPVISASWLKLVKPNEWQWPWPHITLKVHDPQTGKTLWYSSGESVKPDWAYGWWCHQLKIFTKSWAIPHCAHKSILYSLAHAVDKTTLFAGVIAPCQPTDSSAKPLPFIKLYRAV